MSADSSSNQPGFTEFVVLIALIISLVALSIDAMLPALPEIAADLQFEQAKDAQFVISMLFVGMGFGQIIFGPLSDSIGRKPAINLGFIVFIVGCLLSIFAQDFSDMMIGRFLQGLGAAGPGPLRGSYYGQSDVLCNDDIHPRTGHSAVDWTINHRLF